MSGISRLLVTFFAVVALAGCASKPGGAGGKLGVQVHRASENNGSVNSYLIHGDKDALLVDTQLVNSETQKVIEMINKSGKTLRWVYVSHAHPDHFNGLEMVKKAFPQADIIAKRRVAEAVPKVFAGYRPTLEKFFPGDIAASVTTPRPLEENTLAIEGTEIRVVEMEAGEAEYIGALYVPSMKALFASDTLYHNVHPWLNEMRLDGVLKHVEQIQGMPDVEVIYPGHGDKTDKAYLPTYTGYVKEFQSAAATAKDANSLIAHMQQKYPQFKTMAGLRFSAEAHVKKAPEASTAPKKGKKGKKGKK